MRVIINSQLAYFKVLFTLSSFIVEVQLEWYLACIPSGMEMGMGLLFLLGTRAYGEHCSPACLREMWVEDQSFFLFFFFSFFFCNHLIKSTIIYLLSSCLSVKLYEIRASLFEAAKSNCVLVGCRSVTISIE